jgi:hypothetical protein
MYSTTSTTAKKLLCGIVKQSKINYPVVTFRVTRFDDFSPIVRFFVVVFDNYKIWATNFNAKSYVPTNFVKKWLGLYFWQTHLVTQLTIKQSA